MPNPKLHRRLGPDLQVSEWVPIDDNSTTAPENKVETAKAYFMWLQSQCKAVDFSPLMRRVDVGAELS